MSEAITKACDNPNCAWAHFMAKAPPANCPDCNGTGRVPDVEATLRAEVTRLTEDNAYLKGECDEFHAQVKRMGAGMQEEHLAHQAEIARLTAEVERLKEREEAAKPLIMAIREDGNGVVFCPCCWKYWTKDASGCADGCPRAAWLAGCKP